MGNTSLVSDTMMLKKILSTFDTVPARVSQHVGNYVDSPYKHDIHFNRC